MNQEATPRRTAADLAGPAAEVRAELERVDAKASTLLAVTGIAGGVGLATLGQAHPPLAATVAGWAAITALGLAVALLALAVRPRLRLGHQPVGGYRRYTHATPSQLLDGELTGETPEQVIGLARLVHTKYLLVRGAVDLILIGLAATAAATTILAV